VTWPRLEQTGGQQRARKVVFSPSRLFKRVESISGRDKHTAILINFPVLGGFSRVRASVALSRVKNSDKDRTTRFPQEGRARGKRKYTTRNHPSCVSRGASLAGESRRKKINATCVGETKSNRHKTQERNAPAKYRPLCSFSRPFLLFPL